MRRATLGLFLALTLLSGHASADFLNSIANGISSATGAVSSGVGTAASAVGSGVTTAVGAVGSGIGTAVNATTSGVNTALNATSRWVSTATGSIRDAYNVSRETVENFTSSVQTALAPAAGTVSNTASNLGNQIYNVSSGTYQGIVNYNASSSSSSRPSQSGAAPVAGPATTQDSTVDATNATSIINAISSNSSGFIGVANSLLVALGQEKSAAVETGIKNVVNNSTGNTSYPAAGPNNTISLGLAQAVVTAIVTANNYSVTVQYQGRTNQVNASDVADVFLAGLQDAITPCARNATTTTNATAGSETYFRTIASDCCFLVAQPLTYVSALCQSNGVGGVFEDSLSQSQLLGQAPSLDLTRCLSNQTSIA